MFKGGSNVAVLVPALYGLAGSVQAAVPAAVTTAIGDAGTDAVSVATAVARERSGRLFLLEVNRASRNHRGDGVFENQLFQVARFQHHGNVFAFA